MSSFLLLRLLLLSSNICAYSTYTLPSSAELKLRSIDRPITTLTHLFDLISAHDNRQLYHPFNIHAERVVTNNRNGSPIRTIMAFMALTDHFFLSFLYGFPNYNGTCLSSCRLSNSTLRWTVIPTIGADFTSRKIFMVSVGLVSSLAIPSSIWHC